MNLKLVSIFILGIITLFSCIHAKNMNHVSDTNLNGNSVPKSPVLENRFLMVNKNKTTYCNGNDSTISDRVIVALTDTKIKSSKGKINLVRGECAVFHFAESYEIMKGEYFEIAIKKNHPKPIKPKVWYEPTKNASVIENEDFRIFKEQLGAGEERAFHSHLERLVVRLNKVQLTDPRFYPNGQEGVGIQEPNTVKFADPVEHVVKNLGNIPLFNIVLEFKPWEGIGSRL